ncbi:hypothetical protein TI39_contig306g00018 [Zymoseptoria brevis]|uniref:Uncharacterized protein n=1 Tax=Zymoseptoria brevis TaxID=1047168 RepID=A0A0F4GVD7_9PEZI|nr:hypothetical protein TI39_contig306g00018 [Zymoseptoria brevis]
MAPPKAADGSNRTITSFFKKFIPPQSSILEEEIVVASRPPSAAAFNSPRRASQLSKDSPKTWKIATPKKRSPGRPRKSPMPTSPLSSSVSAVTLPSRERGRPRKSSPTSAKSKSSSTSVTPTKSTSRFDVNPMNGEAEVTPTPDSPFRKSISPTQRVLLGSSKRKSPDAMAAPPLPSQPVFIRPGAPKPAGPPSSSSTLSSVPLSSQPSSHPISTASSSKRVTKGGLKGVTNSDSDTDDSSGEDIPDIMELISNKRVKLSPPVEAKKTPTLLGRQTTRLSNGSRQSSLSTVLQSPPRKVYRNSLKSLVAQKEKQNMSEAMIASMEMELDESVQREEMSRSRQLADTGSSALLAAAGSDDEDQERVRLALARTEALQNADQYHFFLDDRPREGGKPFPVADLPDAPWSSIFRNENSRAQACITGFAAELAGRYGMPWGVTSWFADQLVHEPNEQLRDSYVDIIRAASKFSHSRVIGNIGSPAWVYHTPIIPRENEGKQSKILKGLPFGLEHSLRALAFCAPADDSFPSIAPSATCNAISQLALLNIDELVKQDAKIQGLIANAIHVMLEAQSAANFDELVASTLQTFFDRSSWIMGDCEAWASLSPLHRYQAIASLPANALRAHTLRRRLALECLSTRPASERVFPSETCKITTIADYDWPSTILRTLRTDPNFTISDTTDYTLLSAQTRILDIALGAGFSPYATIHPAPIPPAHIDGTGSSSSHFFSRPTLPPQTAEEKAHNDWVDAIIAQLKGIMARIKDSGTSHLRRTEAKCGLEGVVLRLEGGVRTRKRGKKSVFQAGTGGRKSVGFAGIGSGGVSSGGGGSGILKQKEVGKAVVRFDSGPGAEIEEEETGGV